VIDRGRKVAEGTPDELKSSVGNSSLHLLLTDPAQISAAAGTVRRLLRSEPVLTPERGRVTVPLDRPDEAADVLVALRAAGISVASVSVQKPSLDEVFLALTGHDTHPDTHGEKAA
jgi:ABC-2 type transport system ATP-binding protein